MQKIVFVILLISGCNLSFGQRHFFTGISAGLTKYRGDLGKSPLWQELHPSGSVSALAEINDRMLIRAELNYGKISGSDKYDARTIKRNLSFESSVTEVALLFEYILFNLYDYKVSPYFFTGIASFKFSPYTYTKDGQAVLLAELGTEGQGFYAGRQPYKLNVVAIPFGGGLQWALNDNLRIAAEIGIRKTFTDYLDDVSRTYADQVQLTQQRGGTAALLAYRGAELPGGSPYPAAGTRRGNPDTKDWYAIAAVHFRFSLNPHRRMQVYKFKPIKAKTSCPNIF